MSTLSPLPKSELTQLLPYQSGDDANGSSSDDADGVAPSPTRRGQHDLSRLSRQRRDRNNLGRSSVFEALRIEAHEGVEVSEVELFSDLAVVVAIHVMSDILAEGGGRGGGGEGGQAEDVDGTDDSAAPSYEWPWFFLRIIFLYMIWFQCMYLTNLSNLFTSNAMGVRHHATVFGVMFFIVLFVKACQNGHDRASVAIFLAGFFAEQVLFAAEAYCTPRPAWISPDRYENIHHVAGILWGGAILQCLPLLAVLVFLPDGGDGTNVYLLWAGAWTVLARVAFKAWAAAVMDRRVGYDQGHDKLFDKEHLHERYGLIMLIFLGELCFASASEPGEYLVSLGALVTGMGCFLNYFVARVEGRTEAWVRSAKSSVWCQHLHMFLFCTVPTMGVAFVRIMKQRIEDGEGKKMEEVEHEGGGGVALSLEDPAVILGFAVGSFLVLMGCLELLTSDPVQLAGLGGAPRLRLGTRVFLNFAAGSALIATLPFIPSDAVVYAVPALTMTIGIVQVWGNCLR